MAIISGAIKFEEVSITINSSKFNHGYPENFTIMLDSPINRIRSFYIESVEYPNSEYVFNNGNDILTQFKQLNPGFEIFCYLIRGGQYTGAELAIEITARLNEARTETDTDKFGVICSYADNRFKFTVAGVVDAEIDTFQIMTRRINDFTESIINRIYYSSITPLISIGSADSPGFSETGSIDNPTRVMGVEDLENPGEFLISSEFNAYETFTVATQNRSFGILEADSFTSSKAISFGTGISGFEVARLIEEGLNTISSNFEVYYNEVDKLLKILRNDETVFSLRNREAVDFLGFTLNTIRGSHIYYATSQVSGGTDPTHTITATTDDEFIINENSGDIIITLTPVISSSLADLAANLQTAIDNTVTVNTYTISFSTVTGRFRIKGEKNGNIFPTFTIKLGSSAAYFGFTVISSNKIIHYSDTQQFIMYTLPNQRLEIFIYKTVVIPPGNYVPEDLATKMETLINAGFSNTYTFSYCAELDTFDMTYVSGVFGDEDYSFGKSDELTVSGAGPILGFAGILFNGNATTPIIGDANQQLLGSPYVYIKSRVLSQEKRTISGIDVSYADIAEKISRTEPSGTKVFFKGKSKITTLSNNTELSEMDFRLEDEDGNQPNLNGIDWSFTLIVERF